MSESGTVTLLLATPLAPCAALLYGLGEDNPVSSLFGMLIEGDKPCCDFKSSPLGAADVTAQCSA